MGKKKVGAKVKGSPSDLQGLANLIGGREESEDNAKGKKKPSSSKTMSPRKLADDFKESPLKSQQAPIPRQLQSEPLHRLMQVKITEKFSKESVGSSMPQLLLNANDMRKAEIRSGGQVCVGSLNSKILVEHHANGLKSPNSDDLAHLVVATAWPASNVKPGNAVLTGPTASYYHSYLHEAVSNDSMDDDINKRMNKLSLQEKSSAQSFSPTMKESPKTVTPSSSSSLSPHTPPKYCSPTSSHTFQHPRSNSSKNGAPILNKSLTSPDESNKKGGGSGGGGFSFSKSDFSPSTPSPLSKLSTNSTKTINTTYVFGVENAVNIQIELKAKKRDLNNDGDQDKGHDSSMLFSNKVVSCCEFVMNSKSHQSRSNQHVLFNHSSSSSSPFSPLKTMNNDSINRSSAYRGGLKNARAVKVYQLASRKEEKGGIECRDNGIGGSDDTPSHELFLFGSDMDLTPQLCAMIRNALRNSTLSVLVQEGKKNTDQGLGLGLGLVKESSTCRLISLVAIYAQGKVWHLAVEISDDDNDEIPPPQPIPTATGYSSDDVMNRSQEESRSINALDPGIISKSIVNADDEEGRKAVIRRQVISLYRITTQTDIEVITTKRYHFPKFSQRVVSSGESDSIATMSSSNSTTTLPSSVPSPPSSLVDIPSDDSIWSDVGGLESQIRSLREAIELPLTNPQLFERFGVSPPKGVLLIGPPGTGKTTIAKIFAKASHISMHVINGAEITSRYTGEGEASLKRAFEKAQCSDNEEGGIVKNKGKLLFIDEIDALAPAVATLSSESDRRLVATLLALMDGCTEDAQNPIPNQQPVEDRRNLSTDSSSSSSASAHQTQSYKKSPNRLMVLAATNRPFALEPALRRPGRFDLEIEVGIPDEAGRRDILRVLVKKLPCAYYDQSVSLDTVLNNVAAHTHGFVGADLQLLCSEAILAAVRRHFNSNTDIKNHIGGNTSTGSSNSTDGSSDVMQLGSRDVLEGLSKVKPSALREVSVEVPSVRWSDIGGQEQAKQSLKEMVDWPLKYPQAFTRLGVKPPSGVLLYGPPGCSKTLIAKALATESNMNFIAVQGPELLSKWLGESERALATVFKRARAAAPSIIFFDEIDSIGSKRGSNSDSQTSERLLTQLLVELDGATSTSGKRIVVVAATNRPDLLDDALLRPGRFDRHVYISPPNFQARCDILKLSLAKTPHTLHEEIVPLDPSRLSLFPNMFQNHCTEKDMKSISNQSSDVASSGNINSYGGVSEGDGTASAPSPTSLFTENIGRLAEMTDGLSGAEMVALVRDAALRTISLKQHSKESPSTHSLEADKLNQLDDRNDNNSKDIVETTKTNKFIPNENDGGSLHLRIPASQLHEAALAAVKGKRITSSMIQFYESFAKRGK